MQKPFHPPLPSNRFQGLIALLIDTRLSAKLVPWNRVPVTLLNRRHCFAMACTTLVETKSLIEQASTKY
jgi:hypothetical protein